MDTGTHVVMGIAIGGLATLDPVVANDPIVRQTVMIGAIIGSQAPDFDTILKLRNNAVYIRNHRGVTHSIPAVMLWPLLITGGIALFEPETNLLHLWLWTFLAVILHVFVDIFNAYGTQALSPFNKKWIALGVINIFDPFIFITHLIAIVLWRYGADPGLTFLTLYIMLIFYYIWRFKARNNVIAHAQRLASDATHIFISPTFKWNQWHLVIRTPEIMQVAESRNHTINFFESYPFEPIPNIPIIEAAKKDSNLAAFLSFSPAYRWEVEEKEDYHEVRFIDLRYRSKGHYPFVAIVQLDDDYNIISSYTGWVFSEETLQKKLEIATQ
ncbi:metal-dependent hydrolase [Desertibacillus haloalkaliphilus]|uniref:metal-dependent hydrolase n=1 Tax=Desertibacillus haloalkaliphilus TaxID=1328930 RepID=UPI001C279C43|nr:metal-dependent hydrolase [Desertibacillus haloalkaliphilus]MBU8908870.1 metal-dependent hydrolase [Desertibacillus haloalkaliphilus]